MNDLNQNRILITGGSGYLGRHLAARARERWEVAATYFHHPHPLAMPRVTARRLDVRDAEAVRALVKAVAPAVIVHTAAINPGAEGDATRVNVHGTRHVAQAAATVGARLVHLSTDVVFDGERAPYREANPPHPITAYGRSKAQAEDAVRRAGAQALIVRTSLIYGRAAEGPGQDRQTRWVLSSLRAGEPLRLFTDEVRCPIWIETLVAALLEVADAPETGVLHIAGAQALSRYEFGVRIARFHGVDPTPITPASSRASGLHRPLDCTLDISRAQARLTTPLLGVDEALAPSAPSADLG